MTAAVQGYQNRLQRQSEIAYSLALLNNQLLGGKKPEIYEVFPFWTDDEVTEIKLAKYRQIMERHAAKGGKVK